MSVRSLAALAAFAASFMAVAGAQAADRPGGVFSWCLPPPAVATHYVPAVGFGGWLLGSSQARIVNVERYDPHRPPPVATPTYVIPQTAYLASPLCDISARSWYDGKLFYRPGGVHAAPDTFMIIERK